MARKSKKPKKRGSRAKRRAGTAGSVAINNAVDSEIDRAKRLHLHQGELQRAEDMYRKILGRDPGHAEATHYLGVLAYQRGNSTGAVDLIAKSIEQNPSAGVYHHNLGIVLRGQGRAMEALSSFKKALDADTQYADARKGIVSILQGMLPDKYDPELEQIFKDCFESSVADHWSVSRPAAVLLKHKYGFEGGRNVQIQLDNEFFAALASDELLTMLLEKTVNFDADWERLLTGARHALFLAFLEAPEFSDPIRRLAAALARQCFNNEYVFFVEEDEAQKLKKLKAAIEAAPESSAEIGQDLELRLLVFGMYAPFWELSCADRLGRVPLADWSPGLQPLIRLTLLEPLEEAELREGIDSLREVEDPVSRAVRGQYEENPFPRWIDFPPATKTKFAGNFRSVFPHFDPPGFLQGPIRSLVAGCGTGRHPISTAMTMMDIDILAVDLSLSSLGYAARMARKMGVENIRFLHADILSLAALDGRFHIVESAGVLHHMESPVEGWKILKDLIVPGGLMNIGLYSEAGRRQVVRGREYIQKRGFGSGTDEIRRFRNEVMGGGEAHELADLPVARDFFTMSNCRDYLFHVQEHRFTLPQLRSILEELDLRFIGFQIEHDQTRLKYKEQFPHDPDMTNLFLWEIFEDMNPDTFAGMYQFWCQKGAAD